MLGVTDMREFDRMAMAGDTGRVDLLIGDFVEMHGDPHRRPHGQQPGAARRLRKRGGLGGGLANLVLQAVGTMSLIACRGCGAQAVAVTGAIARTEPARANFRRFTEAYGLDFVIPERCVCATAIGAARCVADV